MKSFIILLFVLISAFSFAQQPLGSDSSSKQFSLSLDTSANKLIVPRNGNGMTIYGVKIFDYHGKELQSALIKDANHPTEIDISQLHDGEYIVHVIDTKQELYKTKFTIKR